MGMEAHSQTTTSGTDRALTVPSEFAQIATICTATEVEIGGKRILGIPDARDLHAGLGVGRVYGAWIRDRIAKYGFVQGVDYEIFDFPNPENQTGDRGGDRRSLTYRLTLDTAKELAMVENNEMGRLARRYFIWAEEQARLIAAQIDGASGFGPITKRAIDDLALVNRALNDRIGSIEARLAAVLSGFDPSQSVVVDFKPMLQILTEEGVGKKRRRQLSQQCSRRIARWLIQAGRGADMRVSRESGRYLFQIEAARAWLAQEGRALIRHHAEVVAGQGLLQFKPRPVPTSPDPAG
jgi:phage anti-repressor protein